MIETTGLSVRRGGRPVLRGVSLRVEAGTVLGVVGPNGAGKSTLLDVIGGMLPYDGSVRVAGREVGADLMAARRAVSAAVPPTGAALSLTGAQYLGFVGAAEGYAAPTPAQRRLAEAVGLAPVMEHALRTYSHGMLKKTAALAALRETADVLVLDESLNGLDVLSARAMRAAFSARAAAGRAVLVCSHDLPQLHAWCDAVVLIAGGGIARRWDEGDLRATPYAAFEDEAAALYAGPSA